MKYNNKTFKILSHELGHNFGMSHDFDASHGGQGGPCDNTGIMSYGSTDYTGWSTCSRSDFERHYASKNWANCLEDISGKIFNITFKNSNGIISCCDSTIMVKVFIIFLDTTEAPTTAAPPAAETTPGGMRMSIIHIATSLIF